MPDPFDITDSRIARALYQFVLPALEGPTAPLEIAARHLRGEPVPAPDAMAGAFEQFPVGGTWGPAWATTWFRLRGTVPAEWRGQEVALAFVLGRAGTTGFGAEALVWDGGRPMQGLSPNHTRYPIATPADGGEPVELFVEAAANPRPPFGASTWPLLMPDPDGPPLFALARAELTVVDRELGAFAHDLRVLVELLAELRDDDPRAARLRHRLNAACNALDLGDVRGTFAHAWPILQQALGAAAAPRTHRVHAVGHAHLDSAWLWPLRETVRKAARTFSTAVRLMDRYPEYRFACSQAQQLAWMKEHYPHLYARIREKVASGQFEPTGSMWVEPDCNVPSGESLVRQIVYGKRFYLDEFDIETRDVWLPDVFGYSGALPQIMRRAGIDWFLTQKLSWNQYNTLPHHSFWWEGIDGSRVFTHFPPADTYGGNASVKELAYGVANFRDHAISDRSLYPFGWSDGGGGPTEEMLESLRRMRDLDGVPRVEVSGPRAFFEAVTAERARARDGGQSDWPVWAGELYFELHRGTYTTQAATKLGNRRAEIELRDAELWAAAAHAGDDYPAAELEAAWKTLLLHQFHDIIPGSGIHWVYDDTARDHDAVRACANTIVDRAARTLAAEVDTAGMHRPVVIFNSTTHDRAGLVELPASVLPDGPGAVVAVGPGGDRAPVQPTAGGSALASVWVPACGYAAYDLVMGDDPPTAGVTATVDRLENERLRVRVDADGLLTSIVDKVAGRETLASGTRGNLFQLHPDYPNFYDAWDVDRFAFEEVRDLTVADEIAVEEHGPLRATLRIVRTFRDSRITQRMSLATGAARIEFATEVDWHESNRLLKVAFPLAVHASHANYEIQFGHIERPTHANTSWDEARFEVCAQQWADLSEPGYGVALLNDCKYGYDTRGNVLRLSLLRAPSWPDPVADRGRHLFTYALLPHAGDLGAGRVVEEARELNTPLRVLGVDATPGPRAAETSLVHVDRGGVQVEALKRADRTAGIVVRLAEVHGGRGPVRVGLWAPVRTASRCDLLERDLGSASVDADGRVRVEVTPFELVTLRLELDDAVVSP